MKATPAWIVLHTAAVIFTSLSLLTGLRIAMVSRPEWLWLSPLLPQGNLHFWHAVSAAGLSATAVAYLLLRWFRGGSATPAVSLSAVYHRWIINLGLSALGLALVTGWLLYVDLLALAGLEGLHFLLAGAIAVYIVLHGVVYVIQAGMPVVKHILWPGKPVSRLCAGVLGVGLVVFVVLRLVLGDPPSRMLAVASLSLDDHITVDGVADEAVWQTAVPLQQTGYGGANFGDGRTRMEVRGLQNGRELFLHLRWSDPTQSLQYLPLVKRASGWFVLEDGFYRFDEKTYYEDKLAVLISPTCRWGADATAHLGPQPLPDKPANWHGKGYHYAADGKLRDLWHWKAVRTNAMYLADDNHIAGPDSERVGKRRYTAGYLPDPKQSGNYLTNWQWYSPNGVVPKRLPKDPALLAPYQQGDAALDWTAAWFRYQPYHANDDVYPEGTLMPSVFYESNQFEGDRGDVRAQGVWQDGYWSLELVRKLDTGSEYDQSLRDGVCLWIAAFDHAQIAHTRHNRPLQLRFGPQP